MAKLMPFSVSEFWPLFSNWWDSYGNDECQDWLSLPKSVLFIRLVAI